MIKTIDPGKRTGFCYGWLLPAPEMLHVQRWGEDSDRQHFLNVTFTELDNGALKQIVMESYKQRGGALTEQNDAMWIIGAVLWMAEHFHVPVTLQRVGDAHGFARAGNKIKRFKDAGYGKSATGDDQDSALKHFIYYSYTHPLEVL